MKTKAYLIAAGRDCQNDGGSSEVVHEVAVELGMF